uniref:Uncharacterized protein n=1 Tax=Globodera rostochiensis TaxID=31243 RepID=A0A914GXW7_GLORO
MFAILFLVSAVEGLKCNVQFGAKLDKNELASFNCPMVDQQCHFSECLDSSGQNIPWTTYADCKIPSLVNCTKLANQCKQKEGKICCYICNSDLCNSKPNNTSTNNASTSTNKSPTTAYSGTLAVSSMSANVKETSAFRFFSQKPTASTTASKPMASTTASTTTSKPTASTTASKPTASTTASKPTASTTTSKLASSKPTVSKPTVTVSKPTAPTASAPRKSFAGFLLVIFVISLL